MALGLNFLKSVTKLNIHPSDPIIVTTDEDSKLLKTLRYLTIVMG